VSNERDELAKLLAVTRYPHIGDAWDERDDRSPAKYFSYKEADAVLAAGYVKAEPAWAETLINDGTYEYTVSSDCDGSNVNHWRRIPGLAYEGQASPWAIYIPEETR